MNIAEIFNGKARDGWLLTVAGLLLASLLAGNAVIARQLAEAEESVRSIGQAGVRSAGRTEELRSIRDLRVSSAKHMKDSLTDMAKAKKAVYETGLSLQEEKRLLEKQLEIMTTYLEADEGAAKIHLLRGDQALKSFSFTSPLRILGGEKRAVGQVYRITSKERYAYIERGKAEATSAGLNWNPPQVGDGPRASPLGEYVLFTDGPLVLHAPVAGAALHSAYPHLCAGLTFNSAKRLYESVFIGNKLLIKASPSAVRPAPVPKSRHKATPPRAGSQATLRS